MASPSEHRVISYEGIRIPKAGATGQWDTISWRDFAGAPSDQKKWVMEQAGMNADEQTALLGLLAKNKNITWGYQSGFEGVMQNLLHSQDAKEWVDPGYAKLSDQLMQQWQAQQGTPIEAAQKAAGAAAPAATAKPDPNKVYPAYSQQELQAYTQNYVMPIEQQMHNLISGDMAQWQGAINSIAKSTGQQGSAITNLLAANAQQQAPLYKLMSDLTSQAALNSPYYDMVNAAVGAATTIGNRQLALGTAAQNQYAYGLIDPASAALGAQSSGILGTNTATSAQGLLQGLVGNAPTGAK